MIINFSWVAIRWPKVSLFKWLDNSWPLGVVALLGTLPWYIHIIFSHMAHTDLLNQVQCHTKCTKTTCLCMKASKLQCRYNCPWTLQSNSSLFIDASGKKKYEPSRNDDRLNIHKPDILIVWRENMDCQPILSRHAVMKYISKYASKAEGRSERYHHMLIRITDTLSPTNPASFFYRSLHTEDIVD